MSVSFCLPHPVAASYFMFCSGLCACTEMLLLFSTTRSVVKSVNVPVVEVAKRTN